MEEREEQENKEKENKVPEAPRKPEQHLQETAHTLLIAPMRLVPHFHPEPMMLTMMTYSWILHKLHEMKQKARERKEWLWQLLSQRSGVQVTPTVLVVAAPFFSVPCATSTPRTFHRVQPFSSRSDYCRLPRRRTPGKSSRHSTW